MNKNKIAILTLLTTSVVSPSHALVEFKTTFTCTHAAGSVNEHYQSWTTSFNSSDSVSVNNAITACVNNYGGVSWVIQEI